MAGEPGFIRAKKLKFYHKRAKIKGVGQLTLAPTGTLVASPSGALVFKTTPIFQASLVIDKGASISGNLNLGGSLDVTGNTVLNGSLIVIGNASIGGNFNFSGDTNLNGSLDVEGNTVLNGSLDVVGNSALAGNLALTGDADLNGSLDVSGNTSLNGSLDVAGNSALAGNLALTGDADLNGSLDVSGNTALGGNLTLSDKIITGVQGGNVLHLVKKSLRASDFTAASVDESVYLWRASAGDVITDVHANLNRGFKFGATATIFNMTVGVWSDRDALRKAVPVGSPDSGWIWTSQHGTKATNDGGLGAYLFDASIYKTPILFANATDITAKLTASGTFFVSSLTNGSIDIFIHTMQSQ
uniref:Uncharacterized protein n=2 Tax=viral metagenome TaxID=1070528 RepID=A0A6M3K6Q9_9ZZZZ